MLHNVHLFRFFQKPQWGYNNHWTIVITTIIFHSSQARGLPELIHPSRVWSAVITLHQDTAAVPHSCYVAADGSWGEQCCPYTKQHSPWSQLVGRCKECVVQAVQKIGFLSFNIDTVTTTLCLEKAPASAFTLKEVGLHLKLGCPVLVRFWESLITKLPVSNLSHYQDQIEEL